MGQQQLLLVILVTIIVGIATVVAINTFGSAAESANLDAVRNDIAAIASSSQGYFIRPEMLGGGGNSFSGMTFRNITFPGNVSETNNLIAFNQNGTYQLVPGADADGDPDAAFFIIEAYPSSQDGYTEGTASGPRLQARVSRDNITWPEGTALIE